ncbi:MAG: hypothetical protein DBY02_06505 [Coprobacter fastidiosus]|nr:MAG: hypothetical protein DBY02_06505 [Coprobacter fastidiosus]
MLYNIFYLYLHSVFHSIRFKVNEDWLSGDNHFFYVAFCILLKCRFYFSFEDYIVLRLFEFLLIGI